MEIEESIDFENIDSASIFGVAHPVLSVNFSNYLKSLKMMSDDNIKAFVNSLSEKGIEFIAIIKNVYVPEEKRNQGIGNKLVDQFMEKAAYSSTYSIMLEVDEIENNNFSLKQWYEGFGFECIEGYPTLMLLDETEY